MTIGPSSFPSRPQSPPVGASDAAGFLRSPVASLSSLGPLTETILFLANVTGIASIDLIRKSRFRIKGLVAHGEHVTIGMHYNDGSF